MGSGSLGAAQAAQGKGLAATLQELLPTAPWSLGWEEQEPWATEDGNEQSLGSATVVCEGWPPWSVARSKQKVGRRGELAGYSSWGTWQKGSRTHRRSCSTRTDGPTNGGGIGGIHRDLGRCSVEWAEGLTCCLPDPVAPHCGLLD